MPETRRLTQSIVCPKCLFRVKPFVLRVKQSLIHVECPRKECQHKFHVNPGAL
jgi:hypothetical protein